MANFGLRPTAARVKNEAQTGRACPSRDSASPHPIAIARPLWTRRDSTSRRGQSPSLRYCTRDVPLTTVAGRYHRGVLTPSVQRTTYLQYRPQRRSIGRRRCWLFAAIGVPLENHHKNRLNPAENESSDMTHQGVIITDCGRSPLLSPLGHIDMHSADRAHFCATRSGPIN